MADRIDKKQELQNHLLRDDSVLAIAESFDPDWFDARTEQGLHDLVKYQLDHVDQFGELASEQHLVDTFGPGTLFEPPVTNIDWLIEEFKKRYVSSQMRAAIEASASTLFDDPEATLADLLSSLALIEQKTVRQDMVIRTSDFRYILSEFFDQLDDDGDLPSFGFPEIDAELGGGMRKDRVYTLVARPKRYKSWMPIAGCVLNQKRGIPTMIQQLEMGLEETFYRYACMVTKTPWNLFIENKLTALDRERMMKVMEALVNKTLPDVHIMKPPVGQRTARHLKTFAKNAGVEAMYVDYLGFMETTNSRSTKEFERIPAIMQELKIYADEFPVYVLHHLNREVEANTMYDMRELGSKIGLSDAILKTSDTVFGIHASSSMLGSDLFHLGVVESRTNVPKTWEMKVNLSKDSSFLVVGGVGDFGDDQD